MSIWDGVEEFVMVARTSSFTAAARRLNVSTSHVSRRVQSLEDKLGVKLLARTTRAVKLTDLGRDYLNRVDELIGGIDDANQAITGAFSDLAGPVRVSAAGPFAEAMVMPILLEFAEQNPHITFEVDFNNRNVDQVEDGYDFAIRYGALADSSLIARKLATRQLVCAASPAYLGRYGEPSTPQELSQHSCISANNNVWQFFDPSTKKAISVRVKGRVKTNSMGLMCLAVEKGFGVAYTPMENLEVMIADGRVLRILEGYEDQSRSHWIVYPERRHILRRVRAVVEHLLDRLEDQRIK